MKRHLLLILASLAAVTLSAADYTCEWTAGGSPAMALDGKLRFTYNKGALTSITAWPDDNGKITITGGMMTFENTSEGCSISNMTDGALVFQNVITAGTIRVYGSSPKNDLIYRGGMQFFDTNWKTILANADLMEYNIPEVIQYADDGAGGTIGLWGNPNNTMFVGACKTNRNTRTISYQYQSKPLVEVCKTGSKSISAGKEYSLIKVVKMELRQLDNDIQARVSSNEVYSVWSETGNPMQPGFDVEELIAQYGTNDIVRAHPLRTTVMQNGSYGINTIRISRPLDVIRSKVRFENAVNMTGSSFAPNSYSRTEIGDISKMPTEFYIWPTYGTMALMDGSLEWTGWLNGGRFGTIEFSNSKRLGESPYEQAAENPDWFVPLTATLVAKNHLLEDLVSTPPYAPNTTWPNDSSVGVLYKPQYPWANMCGSQMGGMGTNPTTGASYYDTHQGNLFNVKISAVGKAEGQIQCQHGVDLKCVYVTFTQVGGDIYANIVNRKAYYTTLTNKTIIAKFANSLGDRLVGLDFDEIIKDTKNCKQQATATTATASGYGIRNMHLMFSEPYTQVINMMKPCRSTNTVYEVKGLDESRMTVNMQDFRAVPTNGVMKVKKGGTVLLGGSYTAAGAGTAGGYVAGTCDWLVEKGGVLRQQSSYVFGSKQKLTVDGGRIIGDYIYWHKDASDLVCFLYFATLMNGAQIDTHYPGYGFRVGSVASPNYSTWTVCGSSPSTNNTDVTLVSGSGNAKREFVLDVARTGDYEADFAFNGDIKRYSTASYTNCFVRKTGDGTMLLNGAYSASGSLWLDGGAIILGQKGKWDTTADLILNGGGIGLAAGVTNSLPALKVTKGGSIVMRKGSRLDIAECKDIPWEGSDPIDIIVEDGILERNSLRFGTYKGALTPEQRRRLRLNGKPVEIMWDGYVTSSPVGMIFHVR